MWAWPRNGGLELRDMTIIETFDYRSDGVRKERTGWRDAGISARHREWGFNCPACDLDFLMVEYNLGLPVGLIEYKHHCKSFPDLRHATYRALAALCNGYGSTQGGEFIRDPLPFLVARYWPDIWAFCVLPANEVALSAYRDGEYLSEYDFVSRLYRLRRLTLARALEGKLNRVFPPDLEL